jgi:hypothetical protein
MGFRNELEAASKVESEAAQARMRETGNSINGAIGSAGAEVIKALGTTSQEIGRVTEQFLQSAAKELLSPIASVATQLESLVSAIAVGAADMKRMSEGVKAGGEAGSLAAVNFRASSQSLIEATNPLRASTERIESSIRQLNDSSLRAAQTVAQSAQQTADSAKENLVAIKEILRVEGEQARGAFVSLGKMLEQFEGHGKRLDGLDEQLGAAFELYAKNVKSSVDTMFSHVRDLQAKLGPALDTMREIIERAEDFAPQTRA